MTNPFHKGLLKGKQIIKKSRLGLRIFKFCNRKKEPFACPICTYNGPFADVSPETGTRKHASCPKCGSLERHRLQYLVVSKVAETHDLSKRSILHFAPEPFFEKHFRKIFGSYHSADLYMKNVDYKVNLLNLPFENNSYDFVFASHVLEHIKNDAQALSEISRILSPDGIAIIPVPIIAYHTVEYSEPNSHEAGHVRAPGYDYYEKYSSYFKKIEKFDSNSFLEKYQLFVYQNRTQWPANMPLRPHMEGDKHIDIVPVCFKAL